MNIKRAKEEIEHTVKAYLAKDALGEYAIPAIRQRPILLMGPPGIGKTQVMEQVARECGVALVAYTITHHTRQSAVGLPFIRQRHYGDKDVSVTEYTMSEIIASIYAKMEATGLSEGILFIDEINCVSETLAPTMLQFLQCKTFGNQAVPAGWVIVAAGNPPEYNKSVRDFDIVTLDRVRRDRMVWGRVGNYESLRDDGASKEKAARIAEAVRTGPGGPHTLVVGHPYVDIWQAVKPARVGLPAWPTVPRSVEWKHGICQALGWPHRTQADIAQAWQRIRGSVRDWTDLEPELIGRVEELIDFVTQPN